MSSVESSAGIFYFVLNFALAILVYLKHLVIKASPFTTSKSPLLPVHSPSATPVQPVVRSFFSKFRWTPASEPPVVKGFNDPEQMVVFPTAELKRPVTWMVYNPVLQTLVPCGPPVLPRCTTGNTVGNPVPPSSTRLAVASSPATAIKAGEGAPAQISLDSLCVDCLGHEAQPTEMDVVDMSLYTVPLVPQSNKEVISAAQFPVEDMDISDYNGLSDQAASKQSNYFVADKASPQLLITRSGIFSASGAANVRQQYLTSSDQPRFNAQLGSTSITAAASLEAALPGHTASCPNSEQDSTRPVLLLKLSGDVNNDLELCSVRVKYPHSEESAVEAPHTSRAPLVIPEIANAHASSEALGNSNILEPQDSEKDAQDTQMPDSVSASRREHLASPLHRLWYTAPFRARPAASGSKDESRRVGLRGSLPRERFPDATSTVECEDLEVRHQAVIREWRRSAAQAPTSSGLRSLVLPSLVAIGCPVTRGPPSAPAGTAPVHF